MVTKKVDYQRGFVDFEGSDLVSVVQIVDLSYSNLAFILSNLNGTSNHFGIRTRFVSTRLMRHTLSILYSERLNKSCTKME